MNKQKAIIVDIDNVIVDSRAMRPYLPKNMFCRKAWDEYHKYYYLCLINEDMQSMVKLLSNVYHILFLTGREEVILGTLNTREVTEKQLPNINKISYDLLMRKYNDYRPDYLVKEEYVKGLIKQYDIVLAIDDLESNTNMFKKYNIPTALYTMNKG